MMGGVSEKQLSRDNLLKIVEGIEIEGLKMNNDGDGDAIGSVETWESAIKCFLGSWGSKR